METTSLVTKTVVRNCPICDCGVGFVLHTQAFLLAEGNILPTSYDVVSCNECGFVFADTQATQSDYDRYYRDMSKYESLATASGSSTTAYDQERLKQTADAIAQFFPDKERSMLDVGCANGGLLVELKNKGYKNLTGLDPSPACVKVVQDSGLNALLGGIYTENNFTQKFDGIVLTHVLEHVCDVQGAIRHMLSWLADGGRLYIEVPDASRYKDFFITPYYFFDVEHINHFDEASLRNLFASYDGNVVRVEQKDMPVSDTNLYPAVYIVFEKISEAFNATPKSVRSTIAMESVVDHIQMSAQSLTHPELEKLVASQLPVIVWGAGQAAQRLLKNTSLGNANILFFVDNDEKKHGLLMHGKKILSPSEIGTTDATICICSALHSQEIMEDLQKMGLHNPTIVIT